MGKRWVMEMSPQEARRFKLRRHNSRPKTRLDNLPEDVIQKILSRLPLKEVVQISTLSSGWRHVWRYHPDLIFSVEKLFDGKDKGDQEFVTSVNDILKDHYCTAVNKFKVNYGLSEEHGDDLDGWLSFAVLSKAKNVVLDLRPPPKCPDDVYNFPLHLFDDRNSSCVLSLRLVLVCLRPALNFCGFANLRSLKLHRVYVSKGLHCMLPHCAVLEWLSLTDCFMPSFTMSEPLDHLQYACIQNCSLQSMELHAPNLTVFNYSEQDVPIVLGKFHKLTKAKIEVLSDSDNLDYTFSHLVRAMSNVEEISLRIHIENEARQFMTDSRCDFINLRHLNIEVLVDRDPGCSSGILRLASLLELTPSLEVFNLHVLFNSSLRYNGGGDATKTSGHKLRHLKRVYMSGFADPRGQLELAWYILQHATALERMVIDPDVKTRFGSHRAVEGGQLFQDLLAKYLLLPRFPEVLTVLRAPPPGHQ
ncbi:putative F-box/LRR-repeat protein At3g28410 [Triticum aestivum]|uniref:putative F-box/LRR-repeat protein At3g28410 n=1 Tax=Triticum aestivum TaxID=4565 RepID=UPI001D005FF2|nr:putative F-box/LRR-repeat protein At3g28410 [Triticum aestivum]